MNFYDHIPKEPSEGFPKSYFDKQIPTEGKPIPSFRDFLKLRGIAENSYSNLAWEIVQLNCEFVSYNALAQVIRKQAEIEKQNQAQNQSFEDQVSRLGVDDLVASRAAMEAQMQRLQAEIDKKVQSQKVSQESE